MGKPLSMDLHSRALAAVDEGMSCRAGAVRFGVAAATVMALDGPINGDWCEADVRQVLVPGLRCGEVSIVDNRSSHKHASAREAIKAVGARLMFLPPYSPDFNPVEKAFARIKAMLRRAGGRTVSGLWSLIG